MCTGACVLYGISRVVIGENTTFLGGIFRADLVLPHSFHSMPLIYLGEAYLKQRGIEVVVLESKECQDLMDLFIKEKPEVW